ncbi:NAD(P)-binding protein, partial [Aureobasidium melanogenum]
MTTLTNQPLTFAVIGAGLIGPRHAHTVVNSSNTTLVAICDPLPQGAVLATELQTNHYKTISEVLDSPHKPEAAIICTPNHTHVAIAKQLSAAGIHVLIEKPFSTNIPDGKELIQHLKTSGVKSLVGHHRRFNPYMVAAKKIISSGRLGDITAVNGLWATYKPDSYFDPPAEWRRQENGGVILINLVHEIDLLHYMFGPITRVHAEKTISRRSFKAEEGAALIFRFASGVVGTFVVSDNSPSPYNFEAGTGENPLIPRVAKDFYRVFGSEASLSIPDMTIWSYRGTEKSWHSEMVKDDVAVSEAVPFELQLQHFVNVIRGEESPSCSAQAGLATLIVCNAIKEALETGSAVDLESYDL